ncbi:hypothetical protein DFQ01_12973 [Paenibacillus cellulosilyticus]|uniref:Uncharacterized protein n=1 Tax=Paenibacillus cellulosilyticus TaxID=375489 RepID=A0A2V2YVZ4_9BACL|nr:hypothetical protein [Paenibacillus cellulosilyticus]PWV95237.1 hypothetical protein DFQ01_12973 [Paenibacillus cellulosilyticus]QKS46017.1 hypothetical protein HUB94_17425 [Paenibacillus cellulosilyticus]
MNMRLLLGILVMIAVISGCTDGEKANTAYKLEDVTQAMEKQGLQLLQIHPKGGTSPFAKLNDVDAVTFAIDTYKMGDVADEVGSSVASLVNVYIYVFESDKARIEGHEALNDLLARANFATAPSVFANKNIIVIHFKGTDEKKEYDEMIKTAIIGM